MIYTPKGLKKPERDENYSVEDFNYNYELIDKLLNIDKVVDVLPTPSITYHNLVYRFNGVNYKCILLPDGTYEWVAEENGNSELILQVTTEDWTEHTDSDGKKYYSHRFNLEGIKDGDRPTVDVEVEEPINVSATKEAEKNLFKFIKCICSDNRVTIYTEKVPTNSFKIKFKGVGA